MKHVEKFAQLLERDALDGKRLFHSSGQKKVSHRAGGRQTERSEDDRSRSGSFGRNRPWSPWRQRSSFGPPIGTHVGSGLLRNKHISDLFVLGHAGYIVDRAFGSTRRTYKAVGTNGSSIRRSLTAHAGRGRMAVSQRLSPLMARLSA
jgi:hypothetical protein